MSTHTDSDTGDAGTLYARLGGHAGIRAAVNGIVGKELANADIASYFFFQAGAPGDGHPTADQIEECFTNFVGGAVGGPEMYPITVTDDAGSFTCQDMKTAHAALKINGGTFNEFVMIAGAELAALGVATADITTLAGALESTAPDIVTDGDGGAQSYPADGGTSGDAGSLYTQLGGHAGIRAAVNGIVGKELANADIASYFFFQAGAPANGHPTADQIEECFTDFVGSAVGGPETFPTTVVDDAGSFTCRSLAMSHKALQIDTGTFNEFIMIAGAELAALGVSSSNIATLAGALESTESSIVTIGDGGLQPFPGNVDAASRLDATQ